MGTIPAPNIAQDAMQISEMPQNALAEYARVAALKQQTALEQQQTQQAQIQTQQMQQAQQDTNTLRELAPQYLQRDENGRVTGFDYPGLYAAAASKGVNPLRLQQMQMSGVELQKSMLGFSQDQLAYHQKLNDDVFNAIEGVRGIADPDKRQAAWSQVLQHAQNDGIDPNRLGLPQQVPPTDDGLSVAEIPLGMHAQALKDYQTQSEASQKAAQARQQNAEAAHQEYLNKLTQNAQPGDFDSVVDKLYPPNETAAGGASNLQTKAMLRSAFQTGGLPAAQKVMDDAFSNVLGTQKEIAVATNPQVQAGKVEVAKNTALARMQAQGGALSTATVPPGTTGAAVLDNLDPSTSALVQMIGDGKMDFRTATTRTPLQARANLAALIHAYNPDFDENTYRVRGAAETAFTSGPQGQQLAAIDTARQHMKTFKQTADALDNGNLLLANKIGNAIGVQFGNDAATNFQIARAAFAGEVGKAFAGASVAEGDRKELLDKINAASSPAQLKGYADTADELLAGKQTALKRSYEASQQGKPNFGGNQGGGGAGGMVTMKAPNGQTKQVSPDQVDHYKSLGATVVSQ